MGKRRSRDAHTFITIEVTEVRVSSDASVNVDLLCDSPITGRDDAPAFEYVTTLKILGKVIHPSKRTGEEFEITVRGSELNTPAVSDYQARDEKWQLVYRSYRGKMIPVYTRPSGIAVLERQRGTKKWVPWLFVAPRLVSDMLTIINIRPLYVFIHEKKADRKRWIQSFSLQTEYPDEDD